MSSSEAATPPDGGYGTADAPAGDARPGRSRDRLDLESLAILAGRLAHDFNELLVGVLGNAALARDKLDEDSPAYPNIVDVEAAALRAKDLVGLLVRYSGANSVTLGDVRVQDVLREVLAQFNAGAEGRVIVATVTPPIAEVSGAACQVRHLVSCLLANALEATPGGDGTVRVMLRETELGASEVLVRATGRSLQAGRYVELVVADDGHGMDAATRARIFEPFFSTRSGARGVGLAASQRIVVAHRGVIEVESELGRGTTMRVLLPVRRSSLLKVRPARRPVVLVVDDEEGVRSVVAAQLMAAGHEVLLAADGLEAVDVLRAHLDEVDVVILDRNMPRVGGEATFRALRRLREDISVLLCSGGAAGEGVERLLAEGVTGFLAKPFTNDGLLAAVSAALR